MQIGSRADPQHLSEEGERFDRRGEYRVSHELLYTSAARGLKPGSRGFCTVVSSQGIPAPLASALESLSSYRHVYRPGDPQSGDNPVAWSHVRLSAAGRQYSVLSRISDYQLDYSDRSNKLAHHVALETREQTDGGPAWNLAQPQFMETSWDGTPRVIPSGRRALQGSWDVAVCTAWQTLTGDAGWAGVLAESFLANPERHAYIVFSPGMDLLPLMVEAIGLLPPERRWEATFSTYYTSHPPGVVCNWRCVLADSPEAKQSRRSVQGLRINLCQALPPAIGGAFVDSARKGRIPMMTALTVPASTSTINRQPPGDEVLEELAVEQLDGTSPHEPPGATEAEFARDAPGHSGSEYCVDSRLPLLSGMPPPPPPRLRKRRRLAELYAAELRRGRRWLPGIVAAIALLTAGFAIGVWMRPVVPTTASKSDATPGRADAGVAATGPGSFHSDPAGLHEGTDEKSQNVRPATDEPDPADRTKAAPSENSEKRETEPAGDGDPDAKQHSDVQELDCG
jgi:hypothetical protein